MRVWKTIAAAAALMGGMAATVSQAGVVITGTRVIYPEMKREISVRLTNPDTEPALVQAWIDDGDAAAPPNKIQVPFLINPAVARIEPKKGQTLRVMFTGADLPKDRESVYWFNVLEIPKKAAPSATGNQLQLAFRTRIKMFYRPDTLRDDPTTKRGELKWSFAKDDAGKTVLRAENPSPYYLSFADVVVKGDAAAKGLQLDPGMAPPNGHVDFKAPEGASALHRVPSTIYYTLINDYGAGVQDTARAE